MRAAVALLLLAGCGAATSATSTSTSTSRAISTSWRVAGVDLALDGATIEARADAAGEGVRDCRFLLRSGRFAGWACSREPSRRWIPLDPAASEPLITALPEPPDWGAPLADDDTATAVALTLRGARGTTARFADAPALHDFREALLATAQRALAELRARPESCSGCREGEYCRAERSCSTIGPGGKGPKNCAEVPACHARLPPTSACEQDYQCSSRHCEGRDAVEGRCR